MLVVGTPTPGEKWSPACFLPASTPATSRTQHPAPSTQYSQYSQGRKKITLSCFDWGCNRKKCIDRKLLQYSLVFHFVSTALEQCSSWQMVRGNVRWMLEWNFNDFYVFSLNCFWELLFSQWVGIHWVVYEREVCDANYYPGRRKSEQKNKKTPIHFKGQLLMISGFLTSN